MGILNPDFRRHAALVLVATVTIRPESSQCHAIPIPARETTVYVNRYFEVRTHDAPTKYIFNGDTRVARVTGSLSSNPRIQRLRVYPGWNLCSLAVTVPNALTQLAPLAPQLLRALFKWSGSSSNWLAVAPGETLPAGTVLWLNASTNAILSTHGGYVDPGTRSLAAGNGFLPCAGLEAWPLAGSLPAGLVVWLCSTPNSLWQLPFDSSLAAQPALPDSLAPGQAAFVQTAANASAQPPVPSLRIRYYLQDHLGSSSVIADSTGTLVQETAYYPSGSARSACSLENLLEPYLFTQKEADQETSLHYFEARYLGTSLSRFLTPDYKYSAPGKLSKEDLQSFLADPQKINLYAYVRNNPICLTDPSGLDDRQNEESQNSSTFSTAVDVADQASNVGTVANFSGGFNGPSTALTAVDLGLNVIKTIRHPTAANAASTGNTALVGGVGLVVPGAAAVITVGGALVGLHQYSVAQERMADKLDAMNAKVDQYLTDQYAAKTSRLEPQPVPAVYVTGPTSKVGVFGRDWGSSAVVAIPTPSAPQGPKVGIYGIDWGPPSSIFPPEEP